MPPIVDRIALFIHKIKRRGHHSDTWVVFEDLKTIGETFRMVGVIGVQDGDKLAPGPMDRGVQCVMSALVGMRPEHYLGPGRRKGTHYGNGAVERSVVNDDYLQWLRGLGEDAFERVAYIALVVVERHNDGHAAVVVRIRDFHLVINIPRAD